LLFVVDDQGRLGADFRWIHHGLGRRE
jgi:hypothetical protein